MSATFVLKGHKIKVTATTTHAHIHSILRNILGKKLPASVTAVVHLTKGCDYAQEKTILLAPNSSDCFEVAFDDSTYLLAARAAQEEDLKPRVVVPKPVVPIELVVPKQEPVIKEAEVKQPNEHKEDEPLPQTKYEEDVIEGNADSPATLTSEIDAFAAEMEKLLARRKANQESESEDTSNANGTNEISADEGGAVMLNDGACLQVLPGSSASGNDLSIAVLPPEVIETCTKHDNMEGSKPVSVYNCLPHGEEFDKPVLLKLPCDPAIPVEHQAVFHMKTDAAGQPCGTWTMVNARFEGSTAVFLTSHFSYYGVFYFQNMDFQNKAKLRRTSNVQDMVCPGLTCRGRCSNADCTLYGKNVNSPFGFLDFELDRDLDTALTNPKITCPLCQKSFKVDKLVLHDTHVIVSHEEQGSTKKKEDMITENQAVCLVIKKSGGQQPKLMMKLKVKCVPRPGSNFGIDLCFVIDCTGSMDPFIEAARTQCAEIAQNLKNELQQLKMQCTMRIAFVGYRDYISHDNGSHEIPEDITFKADFTEHIDTITTHMASQGAYGGGDACEHVIGGLKEAMSLNWQGSMRALVLITDAPCHGSEFHNGEVDYFPDGDPEREHPKEYLSQILRKNIHFFFIRITNRTDTMITKFNEYLLADKQGNAKQLQINVLEMAQDTKIMGKLIQQGIMKEVALTAGN